MSVWDLAKYGDRPALIEGGAILSYAELDQACEAIAKGVEPRAIVFMLASNSIGSIAGYLAFMNAGAIPLLLESEINNELLARLVDLYAPQYFWIPERRVNEFSNYQKALDCHGYVLLSTKIKPACEPNRDLAVLVSTSGSTGTPKLVRLSYRNIIANTDSIIEYLGITEAERAITSLPMSYVYGLSVLQTHIRSGASLVLTDLTCYSGGFWKLFEEWECTSLAGVPFMYEMLDKLKFTRNNRAPSLRTMTQAGGRLSPDLQDKFAQFAQERGIAFVVMYGASEATARMSYLPSNRCLEKRGSIGIPIPGGRFEIADENGVPVEEGAAGELVYYGDNVSLGYSTCAADLAKPDENAGRLVTGDLARRDEDGFYYIVGRKKRFIKMHGKRTSLDEVEQHVKSHFGIIDAVCSGKDDLLKVFVAEDIDTGAISSFIHEMFGINEKMISVQKIDEIPKNTSGKVLYAALEAMVE